MSAQIRAVVEGLSADDNDTRNNAERAFAQAKQNALGQLLVEMATIIGEPSTESGMRGIVAVYLRKLIFDLKEKDFTRVSNASMAELKNQLLAGFQREPDAHSVKQICAAIASLAQNNVWDDSVKVFMAHAEKASTEKAMSAFLTLMDNLCQFANELVMPEAGRILGFVNRGMAGPLSTKLPAIKCAASLVYAMSALDPNLIDQHKFTSVCGSVVDGTVELLKHLGDDHAIDRAEDALKALEVLARQVPTNFKPLLTKVCGVCTQVASHAQVAPQLRAMALEVLKSIANGAGAMVRKFPQFTTTAVKVSLQMLSEVTDEDWEAGNCDPLDEDEHAPWNVARDAMAAFADDIGRPIVPVLFGLVPALLTNAAWQKRFAALTSIYSVVGSEACAKMILPKLEAIVKMVAPALRDGHQRNRFVAVDTIAILITMYPGVFQKRYHAVVAALARCIGGADGSCVRVRAQAANTVGMFCQDPDDCEESFIRPYLTPLLKSLVDLVKATRDHTAQTRALAAVAAVAEIVDDAFSPYYQGFMQVLKQVLSLEANEDTMELRCAAFIAAGSLGSAVGAETFGPDASVIMQAIFSVLQSKGEKRDQQMVAVMQCACLVCKTMGSQFAKFLPNIVKALVVQATQEVEYGFKVLGTNNGISRASQEGNVTSATMNMRGVGDMQVDLNTTQMEEKFTALELLGVYAETLPKEFAAFAPIVRPQAFRHPPTLLLLTIPVRHVVKIHFVR